MFVARSETPVSPASSAIRESSSPSTAAATVVSTSTRTTVPSGSGKRPRRPRQGVEVAERDDELLVVPRQVADDAAGVAQREAARVGLAVEPVDGIAGGVRYGGGGHGDAIASASTFSVCANGES